MGDKDAGNDFCIWLKDGADDVQTSSTKKSGKVHEVGKKWLTQNFEVEKCILRQSCVCWQLFVCRISMCFTTARMGERRTTTLTLLQPIPGRRV
jgi:hypothetical protein